MEFVKNRTL